MPDEKVGKKKVASGTHCICTINNRNVAYGTSTRVTERYSMSPLKVQGEIETQEFTPDDYDCSVSIARLFVPEESLADLGLFPKKGKSGDEHLESLAALQPVTITVYDKVKKRTICKVEDVQFMEMDWTSARGGYVSEDLSAGARRAYFGSEAG